MFAIRSWPYAVVPLAVEVVAAEVDSSEVAIADLDAGFVGILVERGLHAQTLVSGDGPGVHLMQNWFALSDPAMEEALYEIATLRNFAGLDLREAIPDETTTLNFRHLLEEHDLAEDILKQVNAHLTRKELPRGAAPRGAR